MADLSAIPLHQYGPNTPYTYPEDNVPIEDLNNRILAVNADLERLKAEITLARGTREALGDRLDTSMEPDGALNPTAFDNLTADEVAETQTRYWLTDALRAKLQNISQQANRLLLALGQGEPVDGIVRLSLGETLRGGLKAGGDGSYSLQLDTVFGGDRMHEHRRGVIIGRWVDNVAYLPEGDNPPIPGSLKFYINGLQQSPRTYEEVTNPSTGQIVGLRVTESPERIDDREDLLWVDFEVRPSALSSAQGAGQTAPPYARFERLLDTATDWLSVLLPPGSPNARPWRYWMIDVTACRLRPPYDACQFFITPGTRTVGSQGRFLQAYGYDWDVVAWEGRMFIRWRYDANPGATNGIPSQSQAAERWVWFTENGAGTAAAPCTNFAPWNLVHGAHFELWHPQ